MSVTKYPLPPPSDADSRVDPVIQADAEYLMAAYRHDVVARWRDGVSTIEMQEKLMRARARLRLACSVHTDNNPYISWRF